VGKDAMAFGTFFSVFEAGRWIARDVGLAWDGRSGSIEREEGRDLGRKRSKGSLAVQSALIIVAGGIAGWAFGMVSRPFERAREAIWEGRARWAERSGRLESLGTRGKDKAGRRRKREVRTRSVGRSFSIWRRRREEERSKARLVTPSPSPRIPTLSQPSPMPSALSLLRKSTSRNGTFAFFFSPIPIQRHRPPPTPPTLVRPLYIPKAGATRSSARGRLAQLSVKGAGSGGWRRVGRVLAYVPPYAVGFIAFALLDGDLQ
jgi:hypothetical protein